LTLAGEFQAAESTQNLQLSPASVLSLSSPDVSTSCLPLPFLDCSARFGGEGKGGLQEIVMATGSLDLAQRREEQNPPPPLSHYWLALMSHAPLLRQGMKVEEIVTIDIKPGWKKGTRITFAGKGDESPNQPAADIVFIVDEKPHATFTREGNDLVLKATIPLVDALCGTVIPVTHLDGRTLRVPVNRPMNPGEALVMRGEGMPVSKSPGTRGNLRVELSVQYPRSLTDAQKQALRAALPR